MSEIVKEATAELAPVADAPAADAPTEETAADAMPSPLEASKKRLRKGLANKNCHLKYLEEGTTSLLGDDVAIFAAFDEEGSPRLTRTQTRKRKSGASDVETPSPAKRTGGRRGRKPRKASAEEKAKKSDDVEEGEGIEDPNEMKKAKEDDAEVDSMEKGALTTETEEKEEKEEKAEEEKKEEDVVDAGEEKAKEDEEPVDEKEKEAADAKEPTAVAQEDGEILDA